jgi:hypothetical protein
MIRKILKSIAFAFGLLLFAAGVYIAVQSQDIPPPDVSDLEAPYPDVPVDQNAYTLYQQATPKLELTNEERDVLRKLKRDEDIPQGEIEVLLATYEAPLHLIEEGARRPRCVFPRVSSPSDLIPEISYLLLAGELWSHESDMARRNGDFDRSLAAIRRLNQLGRSLASEPESLIQYLVGLAISQLAMDEMRAITEIPHIDPEVLSSLYKISETPFPLEKGLRLALLSEFRMQAFCVQLLDKTIRDAQPSEDDFFDFPYIRWGKLAPGYILKPNLTLETFASITRVNLQNIGKPLKEMDLTQDERLMQEIHNAKKLLARPNFAGHLLFAILVPALDSLLIKNVTFQAEKTALNTHLALRLYAADHGGLPDSLSLLMPDYLEKAPIDPFDHENLRYDPHRKILWSVGEDMMDQGASWSLPDTDNAVEQQHQEDLIWNVTPDI